MGPGVSSETVQGVKSTLTDMDEMIKLAKEDPAKAQRKFLDLGNGQSLPLPQHILENMRKKREEYAKKKGIDPSEVDKDVDNPDEDRRNDLANEVTVLIDKIGLGELTFSEEEKKRIDAAKRIHLVEVENRKLQSVKISKKVDVTTSKDKKYVQRKFNRAYAPVVALASMYTGKMMNVSSAESLQLIQRPRQGETTKNMLEKWSLIFSKLTDVSVGDFKNFDDFISHTAYADYNNFIYTILCNSYPDEDVVTFTCTQPNCRKDFDVKYKNRALLRTSDATPERIAVMEDLFHRSEFNSKEDNYKYMMENSIVNSIQRFMVDNTSGILVDIYVPSVKEQCENILPRITEEMLNAADPRIVVLAHNIRRILMPVNLDEVESFDELEYEEADTLETCVELMKSFNDEQLQIIEEMIGKMLRPFTITYGLENVTCTNCGHNHGVYTMNLDNLLFQRVQRRTLTRLG
jgi:hypothetical protein